MARPWLYLINPFLVVTANSYRAAKKLGDFTVAAFTAADSSPFTDMLAQLNPVSQAFNAAYMQWTTQKGAQKGNTSSLADQLTLLRSQKIEDWDIAIQNVYKQNTPQYISIFPNKRGPFQTGSQQSRINAVGALSQAIGNDEALQTVKTDIDNFFNSITVIYTQQKGSKSSTGVTSSSVEAARIALCTVLYGILGQLMNYFQETPEQITNYIDVETLRNIQQDEFQVSFNGGATKLILTRTFANGDKVRLINRGNFDIGFALVPEKNDALPQTFITVTTQNELTVDVTQLGDIANRFLIAKNLSATEKNACTVEII
jgi:hypothetical protein